MKHCRIYDMFKVSIVLEVCNHKLFKVLSNVNWYIKILENIHQIYSYKNIIDFSS